MDLEIQEKTSTEKAFAEELKRLLSKNVDRLFWENFEEVSLRIISKMVHSNGSENEKRWVLTLYDHVCRKAGGELREYALHARTVLQDAILHPQPKAT